MHFELNIPLSYHTKTTKLITMTTHLYCTVQKYTTTFIQVQLSINQEFKTKSRIAHVGVVKGAWRKKIKRRTGRWDINIIWGYL